MGASCGCGLAYLMIFFLKIDFLSTEKLTVFTKQEYIFLTMEQDNPFKLLNPQQVVTSLDAAA